MRNVATEVPQICLPESIRRVGEIYAQSRIQVPELPGVYAFWWVGDKRTLLTSKREIVLKGPSGSRAHVEYQDWWPKELPFPCLYIGKSTNLRKRFSLHIKRGCPGRLHRAVRGNRKATPYTTSCQLRFGIEHIFPRVPDPLGIIYNSVGFSCSTAFEENAFAERFFEEDRLVGYCRPWFNIDSER